MQTMYRTEFREQVAANKSISVKTRLLHKLPRPMVVMAYNLVELFERFLGWSQRYAVGSLRFHLFLCAGVLSRAAGVITIKLAQAPKRRSWWRRLWERISSPLPNCNAVEPLGP